MTQGLTIQRVEQEIVIQEDGYKILEINYGTIFGGPGFNYEDLVYEHVQSSASDTWVINHNKGHYPTAVTIFSPGGVEVNGAVQHVSNNQTIVTFSTPYAGTARII